jgi:hypothetical protein
MVEPHPGQLTRRGFLYGLGTSVAELTVIGAAGCLAQNQTVTKSTGTTPAKTEPAKPAFAYVKIDPVKAAERAYEYYFKGG